MWQNLCKIYVHFYCNDCIVLPKIKIYYLRKSCLPYLLSLHAQTHLRVVWMTCRTTKVVVLTLRYNANCSSQLFVTIHLNTCTPAEQIWMTVCTQVFVRQTYVNIFKNLWRNTRTCRLNGRTWCSRIMLKSQIIYNIQYNTGISLALPVGY
jgi:hypothetical protein